MVIGQFFPVTGGAEQQCLRLCRALRRRGHQVKVLTVWQLRDVPRLEEIDGIPVERVWYPQLRLFSRKILGFGFLAWLPFTYALMRSVRRFDVVHAHQGLWPACFATLAAALVGKPVICKMGNSGNRFDLAVLRKQHVYGPIAVRLMKSKVNQFVSTSSATGRDLRCLGIPTRQVETIPNGVEIREKNQDFLAKVGGTDVDGRVTFLFVGSLTTKKNVLLLAEAVRSLSRHYRNRMRVTVLGDGPDRSALINRLQAYALERCVRVVGFVEQPEDYFRNSQVFVLPSLTEGLPNAALEAMSWGLPLILSCAGGNADLIERQSASDKADASKRPFIEGGNGLFIEASRVESLAEAFRFMIDYPDKRVSMGRRSAQLVAAHFSMDYVVRRYEELYDRCRLLGG